MFHSELSRTLGAIQGRGNGKQGAPINLSVDGAGEYNRVPVPTENRFHAPSGGFLLHLENITFVHSFVSCLMHCVFATGERRPLIGSELQARPCPYLGGVRNFN
jgi:hypothetical protein